MMMCSECPTVFVDAETVSFNTRAYYKNWIEMASFGKRSFFKVIQNFEVWRFIFSTWL